MESGLLNQLTPAPNQLSQLHSRRNLAALDLHQLRRFVRDVLG